MKKCTILIALCLLLTGCGAQQTMETISDDYVKSLAAPMQLRLTVPEDAAVQVSLWQSCDRMTLSGSRGSRTVKRLAAERGISPAERDRLPVLRINGCPAVIPGIGIDEEFTPAPQKSVVMVIFLKQMIEENSHDEK